MFYRHLIDKIFSEFRVISRIYLNFAAPRPREISETISRVEKIFLNTRRKILYLRAAM